jgi:hypothetical protein
MLRLGQLKALQKIQAASCLHPTFQGEFHRNEANTHSTVRAESVHLTRQ